MSNPSDTAQALVERFENALDDFHNLDAELSVSAHDKVIAEVNAAKAALLAHMAGVERRLNELQGEYADALKAERAASYILVADDYVRCTAAECNCGSWHKRDTRPTEARDS